VSAAAVALAAAAALAGCGDESSEPAAAPPPAEPPRAETPRTKAPLPRARCPAGLARCRTATGRIVYVERVDPDDDGDAHFVLASRDAITAPGISVIDVRKGLRPKPLPGPGDVISAAGPVFRGSYGQRQIEAVALEVGR
jgi:hypothetical protein